MEDVDPTLLQRDFPLSHALLTHDDLMTRVVIRHFGAVHAVQTGLEDQGDRVTRWSTLYQTATGTAFLKAKLVITKACLPAGMLDRFLGGSVLFGGLLIEAGIAVQITERRLYSCGSAAGDGSGGWGRRHKMVLAADHRLLSEVDECLADEAILRRLTLPDAPAQ